MDTNTQQQIDAVKQRTQERKDEIDKEAAAEIQRIADAAATKLKEQATEEAQSV